jgi:cytochrome c
VLCAQAEEHFGIGSVAAPREIKGWDIDIGRGGSNLPPGSGSVARPHCLCGAMRRLPWR